MTMTMRPRSIAALIKRLTACLCFVAALAVSSAAAGQPFETTPGGVKFKDLQVGAGAPAAAGQVASIHFIGWVDDNGARGREILNSRAQGRPVSFVIGTGGVIAGWNEGVVGMQPGGRRILMIPAALGYGARGVEDVVPPNAPLIFIIELVQLDDPS